MADNLTSGDQSGGWQLDRLENAGAGCKHESGGCLETFTLDIGAQRGWAGRSWKL